ncbi:MAG: hypothetical protein CVV32_03580 [Methanomicrobiales archaeon HGW-Methanomicrobiales-3]|jgi:hypothetical protein|nr:MAG: hypothetical protein CVV32_03580 [Methanomicrobiales archaeon HGW-Methanomicrobiales-3]
MWKNRDPILIAGSDPDLFAKIDPRFSSANRIPIENQFFDQGYRLSIQSDPDLFIEIDQRF